MAVNSKYNFVGGYENDSKGGLLHQANHHVSPGKKQWTWGHGDFGRAWDRNLTDEDGPYIELMCGVYTDNQPDFSWIMPGEEKTFAQYFMPYRDLGVVKNATKEAMVNLEVEDDKVIVKAFATAAYPNAKVVLKSGNEILLEESFDFHPATSYEKTILLENLTGSRDQKPPLSEGVGGGFEISILTSDGKTLVDWKPEPDTKREIPEAAKPALHPKEIESNEQLYLTGLHLEQYRHATYDPREYYLEALRRDPKDCRCNNAMGLWLLRRGQFQQAECYFRNAIETLTQRNPNPINGEPIFNLGLTLRFLGKDDEAFDAFYKSVWNASWMDSGYFQLARIAAKKQNWDEALELIDRSLIRNWHNHKARQLKVSILRKLVRIAEAEKWIDESMELDRFNFGILFEWYLMTPDRVQNPVRGEEIKTLLRSNIHTYIEFSLDFASAGLFHEAIELISIGIAEQKEQAVYPMALYYKAWFEAQNGELTASGETLQKAAKACPNYCFPNQTEAVMVLEWAKQQNPSDSKAPYYLGNFWYNARQYNEAVLNWELSVNLDNQFPTVHRNLALAYFNKQNQPEKALAELEKAFGLDETDSRILMELDQLYKRLSFSSEDRFQKLEKYQALVNFRDDLYLERVTLLNQLGQFEKAFELISTRKFHPWEGGEGKVTGQYVFSLVGMAKKLIQNQAYKKAVEYLTQAQVYPENLGEGKLTGAQENEIFYWLGCAYDGLNESTIAAECWEKAATGIDEPSAAIFYNDQQPDTIFFQGLALIKLGRIPEATTRFQTLIDFGMAHLHDEFKLDYFAVSLPDLQIWDDDLTKRNTQNCRNLIELGKLGLLEIKT